MKTSLKILHWAPRILCILAIAFISLFALDSFNPKLTFWQQIADFLMHMIPSFILIVLLIVAWKWELVGGIIFAIVGLGFSLFIYTHNYTMTQSVTLALKTVLLISFPIIVVGVLFIFNHLKKKKEI